MSELSCSVPIPSTPQELDRAIERYKASDLSGMELISLWQAIRDASLNQEFSKPETDKVPGEDSY